ncbi:MAG: spondin domain-containing protein [Bacteroidota bacterium]
MKHQIFSFFLVLACASLFVACEDDQDLPTTEPPSSTTSFTIQVRNEIQFLGIEVFNTPSNAGEPGPITESGVYYEVDFNAYQGSRLSFATMLANSNDWFFAPGENGLDLFDGAGNPLSGDITDQVRLYDAGTEEEDPSTIATIADGGTAGDPDDDTSVRTQETDVSRYLSANLTYSNGTFTLRLTRTDEGVLTPGITLVHAQDNPLFTRGEADRGQGLKEIAEAGMPGTLLEYVTEVASDGSPLRLSSSLTPFSPGVVYAFKEGEQDPLFTQGEVIKTGSGLEELAEDGSNEVIANYLEGLGIPVAKSEQPGGVGPGGMLTFTLDVPQGYKLGFATMFVQANDWFISFNNDGVSLFDSAGRPKMGTDYSVQAYLFDAGTEEDQPVGFGDGQPMRQSGPNVGIPDGNNLTRRVQAIEDVQFGKGVISSAPGVVYTEDERGGYNLISVEILPN